MGQSLIGDFTGPNRAYSWAGVKQLFACIQAAADEITRELPPRRKQLAMNSRVFSVILLPTSECNVACDYCFEHKEPHRLSSVLVPLLTRRLSTLPRVTSSVAS